MRESVNQSQAGDLKAIARQTLTRHRGRFSAANQVNQPPCIEDGTIAAVLLRAAVLDGALVWLVADNAALADHPDIVRRGLPVFFFDELEQLRGKSAAELQAIGMVRTVFPTGRVLQ
jgi:hypothetical protein